MHRRLGIQGLIEAFVWGLVFEDLRFCVMMSLIFLHFAHRPMHFGQSYLVNQKPQQELEVVDLTRIPRHPRHALTSRQDWSRVPETSRPNSQRPPVLQKKQVKLIRMWVGRGTRGVAEVILRIAIDRFTS